MLPKFIPKHCCVGNSPHDREIIPVFSRLYIVVRYTGGFSACGTGCVPCEAGLIA